MRWFREAGGGWGLAIALLLPLGWLYPMARVAVRARRRRSGGR